MCCCRSLYPYKYTSDQQHLVYEWRVDVSNVFVGCFLWEQIAVLRSVYADEYRLPIIKTSNPAATGGGAHMVCVGCRSALGCGGAWWTAITTRKESPCGGRIE